MALIKDLKKHASHKLHVISTKHFRKARKHTHNHQPPSVIRLDPPLALSSQYFSLFTTKLHATALER